MKINTLKLNFKSVYKKLQDSFITVKDTISTNWLDILAYGGLPLIAYTYCDWRLALATLILVGLTVEIIEVMPRKGTDVDNV